MIDLIKASNGDREALDEIVCLYNAKALKIAGIYVGKNNEDVVQDVWERIIAKKHLLAGVENFDNWLFLVMRNACFDFMKIEKKERRNYELTLLDEIDYTNYEYSYPDILDKIIREKSNEMVRSVINKLPEIYSLPIIMRYVKELTTEEISKMLDLPPSTVKWRLHAGKLKIKSEIVKGKFLL